jgi:methionyl-tRNA synthetase
MPYLDEMAQKWKEVRDHLQISYTDFVRTTQDNHKKLVQEMLQKSFDKGDIYEGKYEGFYCVGCEGFKTEKDLIEKAPAEDGACSEMVCPDHLKKPDLITEKNRFFKLVNYETKLKELYEKNPHFVTPEYRFNEVKSFVNGGLQDFSVSRESNKFGIPLPFDASQVTYVWYDALFNYVTISRNEGFWNNDTEIVHVLGKDISRFHAIFWPAMLMSADEKIPDREYITGYFTVDGQKMSKSLGNVIDPVLMVNDYDRDAVIFNLLYDVPIGADGDFSVSRLGNLYESMLIGGRGNLVNRVTSLCEKYKINDGMFILKKREMFK